MDTGMRLKYHRMKKKMSVEDLASGILLPKELKKIESGIKEPDLNELEALCKKLGIPLATKDNPVGKVLVKNFKSSLLHPKNKAKIMEQYADIHDHPLLHSDEEIELEYDIQLIRFFIITGDLDSAEEKLKDVERFKDFMNQEQFYLYHKYIGNYHYILNEFNLALKTYLLAEKISPTTLTPSEFADLYYSIGISASQCWEISMASKYSEMALKIYQQEFVPKRIVECHLSLGINERRIGNFKSAKEHFKHAVNIGSKLDNDFIKFTTEYNYGYFYYQFQNFELAISHLKNALNFIPIEYSSDILLDYCVLIKCYIEMEDFEAAHEILTKGREIIQDKKISMDSPSNIQFKEIYIEFKTLDFYVNKDIENFEDYLVNKLVPILKAHKKHFEIGFYFGHLGNTYIAMKEFEKASFSLNNAKKAYKVVMTIHEE